MSLEGQNTLNPHVRVLKVAGVAIPPVEIERHLVRFEYIDEPKKRPHVALTFENEDGAIMNMATLLLGMKMRITWGYDLHQTDAMDVVVHRIRGNMVRPLGSESPAPDKPRPYGKSGRTKQGGSRYSSSGVLEMDAAVTTPKLRKSAGKNKSSFKNMRMADVVRHLALSNEFDPKNILIQDRLIDGSAEPVLPEVQILEHMTVEQFLADEAYRRGYIFRYHGGQFFWGDEDMQPSSVEEITYFEGPDLLSFEIDGDFRINVKKTKARSLDVGTRTITSYDSATNTQMFGIIQGENKLYERDSLQYDDVQPVISNRKEAQALARLSAYAKNKWLMKMTLVGNPRVFTGRLLKLDNFGPLINGHWRVRGCRHIIDDGGYTVTTELISADRKKAAAGQLRSITSYDDRTGTWMFGFVTSADYMKKSKRGRRKQKTDPTPVLRDPTTLLPQGRANKK